MLLRERHIFWQSRLWNEIHIVLPSMLLSENNSMCIRNNHDIEDAANKVS